MMAKLTVFCFEKTKTHTPPMFVSNNYKLLGNPLVNQSNLSSYIMDKETPQSNIIF